MDTEDKYNDNNCYYNGKYDDNENENDNDKNDNRF